MELSEEERPSQECRFLVTSAKKRIKRNICTVVGGIWIPMCMCARVSLCLCALVPEMKAEKLCTP